MSDNLGEQVLKTVNVLFVSSDTETRDAVEKKFKQSFASFSSVLTAEEGIDLLHTTRFELVVTDYFLPVMNGMDFVREVKKNNPNMPVIMISDYLDMQFLVSSMNLGVTQFVAKPIQLSLFRNALNVAVERAIIDNLERKAAAQELEILQYREKDRDMQRELAFRKELNIIRNDRFMVYDDTSNGASDLGGWNFNVLYESKDELSGDTYACRNLPDGSVLVFIADAMGKGISASITSILAVSVVNYEVNESINQGNFSLESLMKKYSSFVKDNLLEEEVMCSLFIHLDFKMEKMRYASFTMPRIGVVYEDGHVEKFISNNLPIMNFVGQINITEADIKGVTHIVALSDGIIESKTKDGSVYSPYLRGDVLSSPFLNVFERKVKSRIAEFEDDVTIVFINRPFAGVIYKNSFEIATRYREVIKTADALKEEMMKNGIEPAEYEEFFAAFAEAVMNAYEHGNLNISTYEKQFLLESEYYEEELFTLEKNNDKKIIITFTICDLPAYKYMIVGVRDEGNGYPENTFKRAADGSVKFCGRGIKIISYYSDSVFVSVDRREIFLAKTLEK